MRFRSAVAARGHKINGSSQTQMRDIYKSFGQTLLLADINEGRIYKLWLAVVARRHNWGTYIKAFGSSYCSQTQIRDVY